MSTEHKTSVPLHKPNLQEKIFFFASGLLVSVPFTVFFASFSDQLIGPLPVLYAAILSSAVFTPFIEEFSKIFPLFYRHGETERSIVTLAALVGFGFGLTEFLLYVFVLQVDPIARLSGIVFHTSSTTISAYGLVRGKPLPFFLMAVLLHAANNFFAVAGGVFWFIIGPAVLIVTYGLAYHFYRRTSETVIVQQF